MGATEGVHRLLRGLREAGNSVLLIAEDLDEVLKLSDRILVIYNGSIVGEVRRDKADREQIGLYMTGMQQVDEGVEAV